MPCIGVKNPSTMKCKLIATATDFNHEGFRQFKRSLDLFGWEYEILSGEYLAYGSKMVNAYNYAKKTDCTHLFITDAYDVLVLGTMQEALDKIEDKDCILFNSEKGCWPYAEKWKPLYPQVKSDWKYLNGGACFVKVDLFIKLFEENPIQHTDNDQVNLTEIYLNKRHRYNLKLDTDCKVFQTTAFEAPDDFKVSNKILTNTKTGTQPIFIHGNGGTKMDYSILPIDTISEVQSIWKDSPETHKLINETFVSYVNADPKLKSYRDWIEQNVFGFGERSFLWMWKLLINEIPNPDFLEIGVFRGQILGLIRLLSQGATITGITPLDNTGDYWEGDYAADIKRLHETFKLQQPNIIKGLSTDQHVKEQVKEYDIIYIDGGHTYDVAKHDILYYSPLVKVGGFLVIDDCAHKYNLPDGYFRGHESVSKAVDELLPNDKFQELFNVVHNRVFKRV